MKGYWVGITVLNDPSTLMMERRSARRLEDLLTHLWKAHKEEGTAFQVDVWRSKDNQTSGEAPIYTVTQNGKE